MKYKQLNIKNLIVGKIGNVLNNLFKIDDSEPLNIRDYKFVKDLTPSYKSIKYRVCVYLDGGGRKVLVKAVNCRIENLQSIYLRNEAFILSTLKNLNLESSVFPTFLDFIEKDNYVVLITEYVDSRNLDTLSVEARSEVVINSVVQLRQLSNYLKEQKFVDLPVRKPFYYLLSFPLNLFKVVLKNPKSTFMYLNFCVLFYRNYLEVLWGNYTLGLVHRDLYPDNILYSAKEGITVIDWESAIVSDAIYDIAVVSMIYAKEFGVNETINFLNANLQTVSEKRRFVALAVFNSVQILSIQSRNHEVSRDVGDFLEVVVKEIYTKIIQKKSLFEIIYLFTLNLISLFYKITKLPKHSTGKKIVLCYHSVSDKPWRYSVDTENFTKQVKFLKKYYNPIPLGELLENEAGGVSFTFDDGYSDVIENALPILEKNKLYATMFVIGDYKKVNRIELDNNYPIINYDDIKFLHKKGWEIGYHTTTHSNLGEINNTSLESEIIKGRADLEKRLGFPIRYFAYPKGVYSENIIKFVKKAKYDAAFTTDGYDLKKDAVKTKLSRISIENELSSQQLEALLSPLGLFVSGLFMKILVFKSKYITKI